MNSFSELIQEITQYPAFLLVLSSKSATSPYRKITLEPLKGKKESMKASFFEKKAVSTKTLQKKDLVSFFSTFAPSFKQIDLFTEDSHLYLTLSSGKISKVVQKEKKNPSIKPKTHNRQKQYLFQEGTYYPFFYELGILDKNGIVKEGMRKKFVQVNAFLDSIQDFIKILQDQKKSIRIVDAGCGKGYITFALASLLDRLSIEGEVVGIDSRQDVIKECLRIKDVCKMKNISFLEQSIGSLPPQKIDFLIALHACNTATDVALFKAIEQKAEMIAVAPCCHKELAPLLPKTLFSIVQKHPIFHERSAALLTDAMRCELLSSQGYQAKAIEFIDFENTPKNVLIKARKLNEKRLLSSDYKTLRSHLSEGILLERLLFPT